VRVGWTVFLLLPSRRFADHVAHVTDSRETGVVIEVGAFADPEAVTSDDELLGLALLDVGSVEEARRFVDDDPMVRAEMLGARVYRWGGPEPLRRSPHTGVRR
jgi:uncharacterized protein YciI